MLAGAWGWLGLCVSLVSNVVMGLITDREASFLRIFKDPTWILQNRWIGEYIINSTFHLWKQHLEERLQNEKLKQKSLLPNLSTSSIRLFSKCGKFSSNVKINVRLRNFNYFAPSSVQGPLFHSRFLIKTWLIFTVKKCIFLIELILNKNDNCRL